MDPDVRYEDLGPGATPTPSLRAFTFWVLAAQVFSLTTVIVVAVWMGQFRGGFAWQEDPQHQFNYHPLFMLIGLVFLYSDAIMVYRVFRNVKKIYTKVLHATLNGMALLFAAVGLKAVFDSHNLNKPRPVPNMYSLHSWVGMATVCMFGLQWVFGCVTFLWPGMPISIRAKFKPIHVFFGLSIFGMATATAVMGITEKLIFGKIYPDLKKSGGEGALANTLGLLLGVTAVTVMYILTNPKYKRQPLPEESIQVPK